MLAPVNCEIRNSNSNVTDETYNSKHLENLSGFELEDYKFQPKYALGKKHHPPFLRSTCPVTLKLSMHILEVLTQLFSRTTLPRIPLGSEQLTPKVT